LIRAGFAILIPAISILSVAAALNPRRWTILPRLGPPSRTPIMTPGRAFGWYSIFGPMSPPLGALSDKKILFERVLVRFRRQKPAVAALVIRLALRIDCRHDSNPLAPRFHAPFPLFPAHPA
jgi:hypothetical protein